MRVSPEEEGALQVLAQRLEVSVPRLLVEATLRGGADAVEAHQLENEERTALRLELNQLRRAVGAVGVNVNQAAKVMNATGERPEDLADTLRHVRQVLRRIETFTDRWGTVE